MTSIGGWNAGESVTGVQPPCCPWCGSVALHAGVCPRVKEIEYDQYGLIKRVVFHD